MGGYEPTDVANQALDAIGWPETLGDLEDGSTHAQVLLRAYKQCLQQLLRAAHWGFARKEAPLTLLADATGNTPDVGTVVPQPWIYEYTYPTDCLKMRFVPWNREQQGNDAPSNNIQIPSTPLTTGNDQQQNWGQRMRVARFLVSMDYNYPPLPGQETWDVAGVSPVGRTVILTNVKNAKAVYTAEVPYPSVWDPLFRAAFVAYLASEVAMPIWSRKDPKFGTMVRSQQSDVVRGKVLQARAMDGNEGGPMTSDLRVDWMDARRVGGTWGSGGAWGAGGGWGDGTLYGAYDSLALADGAVF